MRITTEQMVDIINVLSNKGDVINSNSNKVVTLNKYNLITQEQLYLNFSPNECLHLEFTKDKVNYKLTATYLGADKWDRDPVQEVQTVRV